jgi:hypothetical protein
VSQLSSNGPQETLNAGDKDHAEAMSLLEETTDHNRYNAKNGLEEVHSNTLSRTRPEFLALLAFAVIVLLITSVYGSIVSRTPRPTPWTDCGTNRHEAFSNGCIFDPAQYAWVPKECYFPSIAQDWIDPFNNSRQWFADEKLTVLADMEKVRAGENATVYSMGYAHHDHCLYAWRTLAFAVAERKPLVPSKSYNLVHSHHCANSIATDLVRIGTHDSYLSITTLTQPGSMKCVWLPWA